MRLPQKTQAAAQVVAFGYGTPTVQGVCAFKVKGKRKRAKRAAARKMAERIKRAVVVSAKCRKLAGLPKLGDRGKFAGLGVF